MIRKAATVHQDRGRFAFGKKCFISNSYGFSKQKTLAKTGLLLDDFVATHSQICPF